MAINNMKGKYLIVAIFVLAITARLMLFNHSGGDFATKKESVEDLLSGNNPYVKTIETFKDRQIGNQGYSYLPLELYINTLVYIVSMTFDLPLQILLKIPTLVSDILIGLIILWYLRNETLMLQIFSLLFWFINPYLIVNRSYTLTDPIAILLTLLALHYLSKDDVLSGFFYSLAICARTYPIILIPLFLFKSKDKVRFVLALLITFLFISVPFLRDLKTYLAGTLLVHTGRFIQGRPIPYFISFTFKLEFLRLIPFKVYAFLSIFLGWLTSILIMVRYKILNKFTIAMFPYLIFFLITPLLNRTYILWSFPVLILGLHKAIGNKKAFYALLIIFYVTYFLYLLAWKDGYHSLLIGQGII